MALIFYLMIYILIISRDDRLTAIEPADKTGSKGTEVVTVTYDEND